MQLTASSSKLLLFFLFLLVFTSFSGCDKEDDYIPYVPVNISITVNPELANVGLLGYYIIPDAGVNGILIFRRDLDVYEAYDLTCTYLPYEQKCKIEMDNTGILPVCPCCKSEFNMLNYGNPQIGPARRALKQYQVTRSGNFLQISN
jgi:hypothetical protein